VNLFSFVDRDDVSFTFSHQFTDDSFINNSFINNDAFIMQSCSSVKKIMNLALVKTLTLRHDLNDTAAVRLSSVLNKYKQLVTIDCEHAVISYHLKTRLYSHCLCL